MSEFKAITTQEELDKVIGERLKRQEETLIKKYADYDELKNRNINLEKELGETKIALEKSSSSKTDFEKIIEELTGKVKSYEISSLKTRYALENGIPYNLSNRISGDDEEAIKKDAQSLAEFLKPQTPLPPLKNTEKTVDTKESAYKNLIKEFKGE